MTRSEQLFERAVKRIPGGVNSPVRSYGAIGEAPRFIEKADKCYIYDVDGNRYVDYIDSWGPMILGHNFPFYLGFKGGKGIATTGGVIFAFHWQLGLVCAAVFLIITAISKYVSLGSICMVLIIPFILYFNNPHDWKLVIVGCIFTAMAIWRHRANIGRLMNGTENKLGQKVKR